MIRNAAIRKYHEKHDQGGYWLHCDMCGNIIRPATEKDLNRNEDNQVDVCANCEKKIA